jgi:hypothetical protein
MLTTLTGDNYPLIISTDETVSSLKKQISKKTGVKPIHQELFMLDSCFILTSNLIEHNSQIILIQKVPEPITLWVYLLDGSGIKLLEFDRCESYHTLVNTIMALYRKKYGYMLDEYILHLYHEYKLKITETHQLESGDCLYLVLDIIKVN